MQKPGEIISADHYTTSNAASHNSDVDNRADTWVLVSWEWLTDRTILNQVNEWIQVGYILKVNNAVSLIRVTGDEERLPGGSTSCSSFVLTQAASPLA